MFCLAAIIDIYDPKDMYVCIHVCLSLLPPYSLPGFRSCFKPCYLISATSKKIMKMFGKGDKVELLLKDVFAVTVRQTKLPSDRKEGSIRGFELHTFSTKEAGRLKHRIVYFTHPSENMNLKWQSEIRYLLQGE